MVDKYLAQQGGMLAEREPAQVSTGAGDAGRVVATDASGRLDSSFMPVGIGADTGSVQASEALAAGDLVNIYDSSGDARVRKADAGTAGKEAHGFVLASVASGAQAEVFFEGTDTQVSGLTPGVRFLSATTPGATVGVAPTGAGQVVQKVGFATAATSLNFQAGEPILLA